MVTSSGGNHSEHDVVDAGFEPVFEAEDIGPYVCQISPGHQTFGNGVPGNLDDGLGVIVEVCGGCVPGFEDVAGGRHHGRRMVARTGRATQAYS